MTDPKQAIDTAGTKPERRLLALAVSRGVGIGRAVFLHGEKRRFLRLLLKADEIEGEIARLRSAVKESIRQVQELSATTETSQNEPVSSIFGVQLLILESSFIEKIVVVIREHPVNAEWAIRHVCDQTLERQSTVSDHNFREKHLDIDDVANRLLNALGGSPITAQTEAGAVIIASDLRPSVVMEIAKSNPAALVVEHGGWTSHASILAREFSLPMVSGLRNLEHLLSCDDTVIVDGEKGEVILNPSDATVLNYRQKMATNQITDNAAPKVQNGAATKDGTAITIRANVDLPEAYAAANHCGARGIGLFRSESLIGFTGTYPSEDAQTTAYQRIADAAGSEGVKIRTFDIGVGRFDHDAQAAERNPSLGLRSIRLSLAQPEQFRSQIRALLRASFNRKIDIILPMISGLSEILRSKAIIEEESANLTNQGLEHGMPKLGAMIETPSAVLTAREIAQNVDFLCLGTNDLVQYLLAVDRDNDAVADWYQTLHPAVMRAVEDVIACSAQTGIPLVICGEMAGSTFYLPVLIGLGARELSMNINSIRPVRHLLTGINVNDCVDLVNSIRNIHSAEAVESTLRDHYLQKWSGFFPSGILNSRHR